MSVVYMLDTNICSFIMRERPPVVLDRLQKAVELQNSMAISVITYYEMLVGAVGKNASPRHAGLVEAFVGAKGTPIGGNDTMIAGHALAADCVLVTNNTREFSRVARLRVEDWAAQH